MSSKGYSDEILAEPGLVELIRSLNAEDQRLYDFVRYEHAGLYIGADNLAEIRNRVPDAETRRQNSPPPVPIDWGKVQIFSKCFMKIDHKVHIGFLVLLCES